jgi:hypothetical protein
VALPAALLKSQSKMGGMMKSVFGSAQKAIYLEIQKGEMIASDEFGEISCVRTK